MDVLVTGSYGRCGTALIDHLHDHDAYEFTYLNRSDRPEDHDYGGYDTVVADVTDAGTLDEPSEGRDAVVHMAAYPYTDGEWHDVFKPNVVGMYNTLEAARKAEVETFVFLSTNHVVGLYETEHAPELYDRGYGLVVDHADPVRPDSYYGVSKSFGEDLGRYYVEEFEYPKRFYALRIGTVNMPEYDHPYGNAEAGVDEARFERGDDRYERAVARMTCTWQSRRDFAHQIERCLDDDDVTFDVFYGVSDNQRRFWDLEHARARIGYDPQDDAEEWTGPPK